MIQIFPKENVRIDWISRREPFLVCEKKASGGLVIMGLRKYLKAGRSRGERQNKKRTR